MRRGPGGFVGCFGGCISVVELQDDILCGLYSGVSATESLYTSEESEEWLSYSVDIHEEGHKRRRQVDQTVLEVDKRYLGRRRLPLRHDVKDESSQSINKIEQIFKLDLSAAYWKRQQTWNFGYAGGSSIRKVIWEVIHSRTACRRLHVPRHGQEG